MNTYHLHAFPEQRHQAIRRGGSVQVDGVTLDVRAIEDAVFVVNIQGRPTRVRGVAHGDSIHLHVQGRSCRIEKLDPTRAGNSGTGEGQGSATSPMPGVVVSWLAQPGFRVEAGAPLLVIESMKLQMTIEAPQSGILEDLPFSEGQTFGRGAVLARVRAEEVIA
jgi:biotin carboxyl carrier protein